MIKKTIANLDCIIENPGQDNAVILFHGFGADYADLASLSEILDPEGDLTWIFPNGPQTVEIGYAMTGRAWFAISQADLQLGSQKDYATVRPPQMTSVLGEVHLLFEEIKNEYEGIVVGGFSQGAMIAVHSLPYAGDKLKGALLYSTVLLDRASLEETLKKVPAIPFLQSHGNQDPILPLKGAQALYQYLKSLGWEGKWTDFPGGHEIPMGVIQKSQLLLQKVFNS